MRILKEREGGREGEKKKKRKSGGERESKGFKLRSTNHEL